MAEKITHRGGGTVDLEKKVLTKEEFATRLYTLIYDKGWNQSDLARKSGIGRDSISTYINAKSVPSPQNLKKIAEALGVEPDELYPNYDADKNAITPPEVSIKKIDGEDQCWVHVNKKVDPDIAIKILQLLNEK